MEEQKTREKDKNEKVHEPQAEDEAMRMMIAGVAECRPAEEVKLAALAFSLKAQLRSADMVVTMQERALRFTGSFLGAADTTTTRLSPGHLASALKKEFDGRYGAVWHCIVGKSYGSYVTYSSGGFLYFSFDSLSVLLFQTKVHLLNSL